MPCERITGPFCLRVCKPKSSFCKQYTAPHTQHFSRVWPKTEPHAQSEAKNVSLKKNSFSFSRVMCHSHSSLSEHDLPHDGAPFPVHPHIPCLLLPSRGDNPIPPKARTAGLFGGLATQSPLTSYEPNAIVEISSRLLQFTMHQGGHVFAQHTIPKRTARLFPCLRKWMGEKASEGWLHRCSCRREKQVQSLRELVTLNEKVLCDAHHTCSARR